MLIEGADTARVAACRAVGAMTDMAGGASGAWAPVDADSGEAGVGACTGGAAPGTDPPDEGVGAVAGTGA